MGFISILPLVLFILNFICLPLHADVSTETTVSSSARCESDIERNREIIQRCDESWESWGIERPPASDLRQVNECNSGTGNRVQNFLNGCVSSVTNTFVFFGSVALMGLVNLGSPDQSQTDAYVFANGTLEQIQARVSENWFIERCGLGSERASDFINQQCGTSQYNSQSERGNCNLALERLREQRNCGQSPETRRAYRQARDELDALAGQIFMERQERINQLQIHESATLEIQQTCGVHINPYRRSLIERYGNIQSLTLEILHQIRPNPVSVNAYNQCLRNHPRATEAIVESLNMAPTGLIDDLAASYQSFECYNARVRNELYCDLSTFALSGVALPLSSARRLVTLHTIVPDSRTVVRTSTPEPHPQVHISSPEPSPSVNVSAPNSHPDRVILSRTRRMEHIREHVFTQAKREQIERAIDEGREKFLNDMSVFTATEKKAALKSMFNRRPPFRPGKPTSFFRDEVSPEEVLEFAVSNPGQLMPDNATHPSAVAFNFEYEGDVYFVSFCRVVPCESGGMSLDLGEVITLFPVCGPNIRTLLGPYQMYVPIKNDTANLSTVLRKPTPCTM